MSVDADGDTWPEMFIHKVSAVFLQMYSLTKITPAPCRRFCVNFHSEYVNCLGQKFAWCDQTIELYF